MGKGEYSTPHNQMCLSKRALEKVTDCSVNVWRVLPASAGKPSTLTTITQKSEEPFQDFLSQLIQAVHTVITNNEAADILIKQLAFENANSTCQNLLRSIRKSGNLNDYIKQCVDVFPAFIQGVALAAALKGEAYPQYVKTLTQLKQVTPNNQNNRNCYNCGESGHFNRQCPKPRQTPGSQNIPSVSQQTSPSLPKTICP